MIATDEDALICDFAETYHIYDYQGLPVQYAAVLACGLGPNSRIKMAISKGKAPTEVILLAAILDRLSLLVWLNTRDAQKGRNRPKPLVESLLGGKQSDSEVTAFECGAAFEHERERLMKVGGE